MCLDAVRSNRMTSGVSNDDVERVVREWLRTAKDRGRAEEDVKTTAVLSNFSLQKSTL